LNGGDITFVLTSGGHNAGVVSEPGHPHRHFRLLEPKIGESYVPPEDWQQAAARREGSWWESWLAWLDARSSALSSPPEMGAPSAGYAVIEAARGS
jgi:polyhydroxyalkanoate synthase